MKSGAYLYLEVPNRDDCFKSDVFPHTLFFSKKSLSNLLTRSGFEILEIEEFGKLPGKGPLSFLLRIAYRVFSEVKLKRLAIITDAMLWKYQLQKEGIWLRAMVRKKLH